MPGGRKALLPSFLFLIGLICFSAVLCCPSPVQASSEPEVTTKSATDVGDDSATLQGEIESDGNDEITEYGFEWGTSESDLDNTEDFDDDIDEGDEFDYELDDLDEDETYYYRAYAKNDEGTDYGSTKHFTTDEDDDDNDDDDDYYNDDIPLVTTKSASSIAATQATLNAEIEETGDSDIEEYGFFYGTSSSCSSKQEVGTRELDDGEDFDYALTGLVEGTVYYYKAYAENDEGTSYGSLRYFTAGDTGSGDDNVPLVTTVDDVDVDGVEVELNAEIEAIGGSEITEYGFYYGTSTSCTKQKKVGSDSIDAGEDFDCTLKNLREYSTYYYKAYAKNSQGTSYGSMRYYDTDDDEDDEDGEDEPSVITKSANVGEGYATLNGEITDTGDSDIESYGFYWGTSSSPGTKLEVGDDDIDEDDTFDYQLNGLSSGTTYYFKAYATNDDGTDYGSVLSFTAGGALGTGGGSANLTTSIGAVAATGVTVNGSITSTGGSTVRDYGFVWGKIGAAETKIRLGSSILANTNFGYFFAGLEDGSTYYAKSYAITGAGTSYGPQLGFTAGGVIVAPLVGAPTVVISSPAANINVARGAMLNISASASDVIGIEAMGLYIDGVKKVRPVGSRLTYSLDTASLPTGPCTIRVTAWNGSRSGESTLVINIQESTASVAAAPKVTINSPVEGFKLTTGGSTDISASASSERGVQTMVLYINEVQKISFMGASFTYRLDSLGMTAGTYNIRITAWDGAQTGEKTLTITIQ